MFYKHPIINKAFKIFNEKIPSNCVGIHGNLYEINNFDHPGGNTFIEINKGCDITVLFETHHINYNLAYNSLKNLNKIGTYKQDIFYNYSSYYYFRNKVLNIFQNKKSRLMNNFSRYCLISYICLGSFTYYKMLKYTYDNLDIFFIPICLINSLVCSILGGFGHNGIHKLNFSSLLLDWNGLSSLEWLLEHVHSHHMYTNTIYDHDAISMIPFLNWLPSKNKSIFGTYGKHLIFSIAELIVPIQGNLIHRFRWSILFNNKYPIWLKFAPIIFVIRILLHINYQGIIFGIVNLSMCLIIAGYYFAYLAHLNHINLNNKNYDKINNLDFIEHQMENTNDLKINNYFTHLFLHLNKQNMHHLFPTIDHSQLYKVYDLLNDYKLQNINNKSKSINLLNFELNKLFA